MVIIICDQKGHNYSPGDIIPFTKADYKVSGNSIVFDTCEQHLVEIIKKIFEKSGSDILEVKRL